MNGFMMIHRKVMESWQWKDPVFRSAWMWLLMNAEWRECASSGLERGQVRFSLRQAKDKWGMSKNKAQRFLKALEEDGSIHWQKGRGGKNDPYPVSTIKTGTANGTANGTTKGRVLGVITILKYNEYNPAENNKEGGLGTTPETQNGPYINKRIKNKEEEYANNTPSENRATDTQSPKPDEPEKPKRSQRKAPILRRGPELEKALDDLEDRLPELYEQYEPSIVDDMYERFRLKTIESENQYNYRHFFAALSNWLKKENQPVDSKDTPPTDPKLRKLWERCKREGKLGSSKNQEKP